MKNFDDFITFANSSEFQETLITATTLDIDAKAYNLASEDDIAEFIHKCQSSTLNGCMKLLRAYHEWANQ